MERGRKPPVFISLDISYHWGKVRNYENLNLLDPGRYIDIQIQIDIWRRKWQPTSVFMPGKSHGLRNLVGYRPWDRKESDTTERLHFHFQTWYKQWSFTEQSFLAHFCCELRGNMDYGPTGQITIMIASNLDSRLTVLSDL